MAPKSLYLLLWISLILVNVVALEPTDLCPKLHFTHQPQDVVATKDERLVLNCSAEDDAGRAVNITWRKDLRVLNDGRHHVLHNGSLLIRHVRHRKNPDKNDEGIYECLAKNTIGTIASRKFRVDISNLSTISGEPQSSTVYVGWLARFECRVEGNPSPSISWEKDGQPLPQDSRYTALTSGVLQISDVQLSDAGLYKCWAHSAAHQPHNVEARLTVLTERRLLEPYVLAGPQHASRVQGESVVFECAINSFPRYTVVWVFEGSEVPPTRGKILGTGNLQLEDLRLEDAGVYHCAVERPGETRLFMAQARLTILVPPKLIYEPEGLSNPRAITARFKCGFSGHPRPTVRWLMNGQPIESSGRTEIKDFDFREKGGFSKDDEVGSMLVLLHSTTQDSGYYQCQAENKAGQASATARLYIQPSSNSPDPPKELTAYQVSSTRIKLTWKASPAKSNHAILGYSVHYLPTEGGSAELQRVTENTSCEVEQLEPHTNYTFYVVAYNDMSASEHSRTVTQVTGEDVPTAGPWCTVASESSTSLQVSWSKLEPNVARGIITAYRVIYRELDAPHSEKSALVEGDVLEHTITGLRPDQQYDVRVVAGTSKGFPELDEINWPWFTWRTDRGTNTLVPKPPVMTVEVLNSTHVWVKWKATETPEMPMVGYRLSFGNPQETARRTIIFQADDCAERTDCSYRLPPLESDTTYEITLLGFNGMGDGEKTSKIVRTKLPFEPVSGSPPAASPPPPEAIEAEPVNATTVHLKWDRPQTTDINIDTTYRVRYNPVVTKNNREVRNTSQVRYLNSRVLEAVVTGLEPYTMYEFSVRSQTSSQEGPYSSEIPCRTMEGMPSAPVNPDYELLASGGVRLKWKPPAHKNGIIQSYVIQFTEEEKAMDSQWRSYRENGSVTETVVNDVELNTIYRFKLHATTSVGAGQPSVLLVSTKGWKQDSQEGPFFNIADAKKEKTQGIIAGTCIGAGCIVICAIIVLLRHKCFPPRLATPEVLYASHNSSPSTYNGYLTSQTVLAGRIGDCSHEMDSFLPRYAVTPLSENEHSDSKGGPDVYYAHNKKIVGIPVSGLRKNPGQPVNTVRVTYLPSGHFCRCPSPGCCSNCTSSECGPEVPLRSTSLLEAVLQPDVEEDSGVTTGEPVTAATETSADISSEGGHAEMDTCSTDCDVQSHHDAATSDKTTGSAGGRNHGSTLVRQYRQAAEMLLSSSPRMLSRPPPLPPHRHSGGNRRQQEVAARCSKQQQRHRWSQQHVVDALPPSRDQQQQCHLSSFGHPQQHLPQVRPQDSQQQHRQIRLSPNAGRNKALHSSHNNQNNSSQDHIDLQDHALHFRT